MTIIMEKLMRFTLSLAAVLAVGLAAPALAEDVPTDVAPQTTAVVEPGPQEQSIAPMVYQKLGQAKCSRFGAHRRVVWKMSVESTETKPVTEAASE